MKKFFLFISGVALICTAGCRREDSLSKAIYKDATSPIEKRVEDLLSRMTLEEKAGQLDMLNAAEVMDTGLSASEAKMSALFDSTTYGSIHDLYPVSADVSNQIQRYVIEHTRLGIPLLFIEEALHGYQGKGGTTFPNPLCNASSWDTTLLYKIGRVIGTEARAHGIHLVLGPNLDLAREPRWGRVEETFGEDAYLSARMAVNIVKGIQGDTLAAQNAVVAEPKHFGIHGIPENGSNLSPVDIGEREARSTHLRVFEAAIKEAKARSVMAAYHEIDGIPAAGNSWLLTHVLRDEWGFKGFVISDLGAIAMQYNKHFTATSAEEAIAHSINAGLNMQFYDFPHDKFIKAIVNGVKNGNISQETLDKAVGDVLRVKFELGLFDHPYTDTSLVNKTLHCKEHEQLAYHAALESIVLLKNDQQTLPFSKKVKRVAVIGRLANTSLLGGYSPQGAKALTLIEALKERFGDSVSIDFLNGDISPYFTELPSNVLHRMKGQGEGVDVEYYNNLDFSGSPVYTTVESGLSHYWHNLSPGPGVQVEPFCARLSTSLRVPTTGDYEFSFIANNYGRLFVNGKLVLDHWSDKMTEMTTTTIQHLEKNKDNIVVIEYGKVNDFAGERVKCRFVGGGNSMNAIAASTAQALKKADVVIVVAGESSEEVGEGKDRQNMNINDIDMNMARVAAASGKPMVTILYNGRPLLLEDLSKLSPAIIEAWFPGEYGGKALADILFGDANPSGKLTISFPKSMGQLPIYYAHKPSATRSSIDGSPDPLYAFGHGLSYSKFEYDNLSVLPDNPTVKNCLTVSCDVRNTSQIDGTEIVQLYIRDIVSSTTTPVMSLKGFARVYLKAGETKRVSLTLTPDHLSLLDKQMKRVTEP
ncbi:MAG: glycoside hydrolase family 3 C-terminal domain-containing protein [Bacteroidales bacterium]|jgi:beta-glucosidase|nr:glycoside hydrolase family 3 C-terminal domain-containing protein [Bacteroidales bacterium]